MATSPKSDLSRYVGKLEGIVALLVKLAIGVLGLLGLLVAGGFSIHSQLDALKTELALAERDIGVANDKLTSLQGDVGKIRDAQSSAATTLARLEDRLSAMAQVPSPPISALQISTAEAGFIRDYLTKLTGLKPIVKAGYKIGDLVSADQLLDFPSLLQEKLPKLKNTKYTVDEKGSIIIASADQHRVLAVLYPA